MKYIKKNIWELFAITMLTGLFILSYVLYALWGQISLKYKLEQENVVRISAHSTMTMLSQYEVTLDILGEYLIKDYTYKDIKKSKKILKNLLNKNQSIAGLGLVNPDGKLYVTSIDKSVDDLPNLFEKEETKKSFEKVFKSDNMVIGRTYYHNTLKIYIIPIRKAIRDKNKNVIAIMTAGIKVDNWYESLNHKNKTHNKYKSFLLRSDDYFFQLVPFDSKLKKAYYSKSIPLDKAKNNEKIIAQCNNMTIEKIRNSEIVVSARYKHFMNNKEVLASLVHIKKYKLWRIVQIENEVIYNEFYIRSLPIIVIFIIIGIFMFFLFNHLSKTAKKNRKKLEYQAEHDYLTTLCNRYYLSKKFDNALLSRPFTLIVLNMDNFKNINENYGHKYGDLALNEIGNRLEQLKNKEDILVRYSGDEFLFIRYDATREEVSNLSEKIIELLYEPYKFDDFYFMLSTSLGISSLK